MSEAKKPQTQTKKSYRKPVLENYGAVRELTRSAGTTGKNDNMSSAASKTG